MEKKRVFSGIQPSGSAHIGNYLGAIKNWANDQDEKENIFCVVDLHSITVPQDPKELAANILETAKIILAAGIDPKKSALFVQSARPEHSELAWILNCNTQMGELSRMTQYKDKGKGNESVSVGLLDYPVLMAADILLYDTHEVPVGEDQKQHVELARVIAKRVNSRFGKTVVVPKPIIKKEGARIMSLSDPSNKMAKSSKSESSYIAIRDDAKTIRKKISKAVTDSQATITYDKTKRPAVANLLTIYSLFSGKSVANIVKEYNGKGFADFKSDLAEVIIEGLAPIQKKLAELDKNEKYVEKVLADGAKKVAPLAQATLERVKKNIGLG